jgi:hypothetical protein
MYLPLEEDFKQSQSLSMIAFTEHIHNADRARSTEHGLREQFGVSINVCRLAGDNFNITCKNVKVTL